MDGSAAVIGEMMLPILEPRDPARPGPARDLGFAFQLTNFLRDVGEDLDRGRVYLPQEDLERFGADPRRRRVDDAVAGADALRDRPLPRPVPVGRPRASRCCRPPRPGACAPRWCSTPGSSTASRQADYDVFTHRVRVPTRLKVAAVARAALDRRG